DKMHALLDKEAQLIEDIRLGSSYSPQESGEWDRGFVRRMNPLHTFNGGTFDNPDRWDFSTHRKNVLEEWPTKDWEIITYRGADKPAGWMHDFVGKHQEALAALRGLRIEPIVGREYIPAAEVEILLRSNVLKNVEDLDLGSNYASINDTVVETLCN